MPGGVILCHTQCRHFAAHHPGLHPIPNMTFISRYPGGLWICERRKADFKTSSEVFWAYVAQVYNWLYGNKMQ